MSFLLIGATIALAFRMVTSIESVAASSNQLIDGSVVIIDPGHGAFDPGAIASDKTEEKDLNLEISLKLYDIFKANGHNVILTRDSDIAVEHEDVNYASRKKSDILSRFAIIESYNDAVFICIHQNSFSDHTQNGTQLFYGPKNENSEILANSITNSVVKNLQPYNERPVKKGTDSVYLIYNATCPSVLVECGFMTNEEELSNLKDDEYQKKLAYSIYLGYCDYVDYIEK